MDRTPGGGRTARRVLLMTLVLAGASIPAVPAGSAVPPPQFVTKCLYAFSAQVDPIVAPGAAQSAHLHDFFGNTGTDENSTYDQMLNGQTTCGLLSDTAGYWAPSLLKNGVQVQPQWLTAGYYLTSPLMDPTQEQTIPAGLAMVAGGSTSDGSQIAFWKCAARTPHTALPGNCGKTYVHATVRFPGCWDGANLDTAPVPDPTDPSEMVVATNPITHASYANDHRSHMSYTDATGACPSDHPVTITRVSLNIRYPIHDGTGATLSSGSPTTLHADFWNTWQQAALDQLVVSCLQASIACGLLSG